MLVTASLATMLVATSGDVIHSVLMPELTVRGDVLSGHLLLISLSHPLAGLHSFQCSELCGILHGFMANAVSMKPLCLQLY